MLKYITVENIVYVTKIIFWAMFYATTAVSLFAALYASAEAAIFGNTIKYNGPNRTTGLRLAIVGLVAVVCAFVFAALMTGIGGGITGMLTKLNAGQTSGDLLGLAALVIAWLIFDLGMWIFLTSEEPRPLKT